MIEAKSISMHYGSFVAVQGASFTVKPGEVVGLLGPNGAGKSTIMRILTTYLYPTKGAAKVAGFDVASEPLKVRQVTGYLPETLPLYRDMEVKDYLTFVGKARGLGGKVLSERMGWIIESCGLEAVYGRLIKEISMGYKQRTALAQALIHDPQVVIMDEPTTGLDPHQIVAIRKLIRNLAINNKTVILSTHIMQEVEAVCDRIIIISRGEIVATGTEERLKEKARAENKSYAQKEELTLEDAFLALTEGREE